MQIKKRTLQNSRDVAGKNGFSPQSPRLIPEVMKKVRMDLQNLDPMGIEEAGKKGIILENILLIALVAVGFLGMYPLFIAGIPLISILYVLFIVIMLAAVLRKHLCTHCYYYGRWCHCGWGKISSALFQDKSGNKHLGEKMVVPTWSIILFLPFIGMILVIILGMAPLMQELLFFVAFVVLLIAEGVVHKKDCEQCRMRFICPGSAVKK